MHRFYLPPESCRETTLRLSGREAHHALHVLRVREGESVMVLDGAGLEFFCRVQGITRDEVQLDVTKKAKAAPLPCQITLLQAIPKGKIIESIVHRATELGVSRIVPLLSERVISHLDADDGAQRAEKWQLIAIEAIKQCGSAWLPRVEVPVTPKQFLARQEKFELPLVASLQEKRKHLREYFHDFQAANSRKPASASIWVGPEGDFSLPEIDAIVRDGALPITLGRLVLRVETATTYCLSVLNHELETGA